MPEIKPKIPRKNGNKLFYTVTIAASVGILLVTPVLTLLVIGYLLDRWLHTSPLFIIFGVIIGFLGSLINIFRLLKTIKK